MAKLWKTTRTRTKVSLFTVFEMFSAEDCEVKNLRSKCDGSKERNRLEIGSQIVKVIEDDANTNESEHFKRL